MNRPLCSICGINTTRDCIPSKTSFKKSIKFYNTDHTLKLVSLKGLGPKYVLKTKKLKIYKRPISYKYLKPQVDFLNCFNKEKGRLFLSIFDQILQRTIVLSKRLSSKLLIEPKNILTSLIYVLPLKFLNCWENHKKFIYLVKLCITRSNPECIYYDELSRGCKLEYIEWLPENATFAERNMLFSDGIKLVLMHIILPLVHKLFVFVPTKSYQLVCVPKETYKRAISKTVSSLKSAGVITKENGGFVSDAAYLSFKPKMAKITEFDLNTFRIIALQPKRKDKQSTKRKRINKALIQLAKNKTFVKSNNFFNKWKEFVTTYKDKRLFMVTLDLSDCFGNVNIDNLINFLDEAQLPAECKQTLHYAIYYQYINFGKCQQRKPIFWKWNHGLLQGMRFSNSLCEFYLSHIESVLFESLNKPNCFIYRKVDDYFFASTKRADVFSFLELVKQCPSFKINHRKTQSNVLPNKTLNINFCGMIINTRTFRLKCSFSTDTEMYNRFRFWDLRKPKPRHVMIDRAINYPFNNFYFQPAFTDIEFNGIQSVLTNFFEGMIYVAYKLDAVVMSATCRKLKECHQEKCFLSLMHCIKYFMKRVLYAHNVITPKFIHVLREKFIILGLRAFQLVFAKHNKVYKDLVDIIKQYFEEEMVKYPKLREFICDRRYKKFPESLRDIKIGRGYKLCVIRF